MPLKRQIWQLNQRIDKADLNSGSDWAYANLALALRHFLAPTLGIVRGGDVTPVPNSRYVTVAPLAGVSANGPVIVENAATVLINPNGAGQPRIDLVYVQYGEQTTSALRYRIEPASGTVAQVPTEILTTAVATVLVAEGTPAASPVAPATPAGAIAIATVRVEPGSDPVTADKLSRVEPQRFDAIRTTGSAVALLDQPLDWFPVFSLPLSVPAGFRALVLAEARVRPIAGAPVSTGDVTPHYGVTLDIHDPNNPGVQLAVAERPVWAGRVTGNTWQCPVITLNTATMIEATDAPDLLRIRIQVGDGSLGWAIWDHIDVLGWSLTAVVL